MEPLAAGGITIPGSRVAVYEAPSDGRPEGVGLGLIPLYGLSEVGHCVKIDLNPTNLIHIQAFSNVSK